MLVLFYFPGDIVHGEVFVPPGEEETLGCIDDRGLSLFFFSLSSLCCSHPDAPVRVPVFTTPDLIESRDLPVRAGPWADPTGFDCFRQFVSRKKPFRLLSLVIPGGV